MISEKTFINMIELIESYCNEIDPWHELGIELYEKDITTIPYKMFDLWLSTNFNECGIDWINWYLYKRYSIINNEILPYYDENNNKKYLYTPQDLWKLVKEYRLKNE